MKFNEFANMYKKYTGNTISREQFDSQTQNLICRVREAYDIALLLRNITINVLESMRSYLLIGVLKHGINKGHFKTAIDVLSKISQDNTENEEEKMFIKVAAEMLKKMIDSK